MLIEIILLLLLCLFYLYISHHTCEHYEHVYTPDEIFTHLSYIDAALTENKIKHWIMYGTLLGAVRNNDIIPYDYDFDLGANIDDLDLILSLNNKINKDGYVFIKPTTMCVDYDTLSKEKLMWRVSLKIEYKGIVMGDIYLYKKFNDGYMRRFDINSGTYFWPNSTFHSWFIDTLKCVTIRNKCFDAPMYPEILLEHWYGKTWKTPIKARAQGGAGDDASDVYGGSKNISLKFLKSFLIKNNINDITQCLNHNIKYIFPAEQKDWIINNDKMCV